MHEFSIAEALLGVVRSSAPAGTVVKNVCVEAGPMRGIEPLAMDWAWQAVTEGTDYQGVGLELHTLPWTLRCHDCGRTWSADDPLIACACGSDQVHPDGLNDALTVAWLDVDDVDAADDGSNQADDSQDSHPSKGANGCKCV